MKRIRSWTWAAAGLLLVMRVSGADLSSAQGAGPRSSGLWSNIQVSLAEADVTFLGEDLQDWSGYSVSPAGDVNNDGYADVIIGAPYAGDIEAKGPGKAYLILGRPRAAWPATHIDLAAADASFIGDRVDSMTGRQNYAAGDVNGDGFDDFIVTCWKYGDQRGLSALFLGRPNIGWGQNWLVRKGDATFVGEDQGDRSGYYAATAGDVNGDGYDDFLITATGDEGGGGFRAGKVYLLLGRAAADWGRDFGLAQADASFQGVAAGDAAGRSAAGAGDVNGDGFDDILIGAPFNDQVANDAGQAYLILGRAAADWGMSYPLSQADASFLGEAAFDQAGRRVSPAGDANGDGYADFLFGASYNDQVARDAGKAYLFLGRPSADWGMGYPLSQADASFLGEGTANQAGRRVSDAGDVNSDGLSDFLVAAPHNGRGGKESGTSYLFYGRAQADWGLDLPLGQADIIYVGEATFDHAGYDLSRAGDVDGDGADDLVFGAYAGDENGPLSGQTYIVFSKLAPIPIWFSPDSPTGKVGEWHEFATAYRDEQGWADISTAQMLLGRNTGDLKALNVLYVAGENAFYLRDKTGSSWLGPCTPGSPVKLGNGVVQLDCQLSIVSNDGAQGLSVAWYGRFVEAIAEPRLLSAYLRAVDQEGHDSGFANLGTWTLTPTID